MCTLNVNKEEGIIQTPNYPGKYPRSTSCLWLIDFGYGINVTLKFTHFDLENQPNCTYDFVSVHAGYDNSALMLGEQYCGFVKPPKVTVNGPLAIHFNSDEDTEFSGFEAMYDTTGAIHVYISPLDTSRA